MSQRERAVNLGLQLARGDFDRGRRRPQVATYAVLAESANIVKVGSSAVDRLEKRVNDIQMSSPLELFLVGRLDRNIEKWLHERLANCRLHGEWFSYTSGVAEVLAAELQPCRISLLAGKELGWQKKARIFGWSTEVTSVASAPSSPAEDATPGSAHPVSPPP